jgi:hypothetical protein
VKFVVTRVLQSGDGFSWDDSVVLLGPISYSEGYEGKVALVNYWDFHYDLDLGSSTVPLPGSQPASLSGSLPGSLPASLPAPLPGSSAYDSPEEYYAKMADGYFHCLRCDDDSRFGSKFNAERHCKSTHGFRPKPK